MNFLALLLCVAALGACAGTRRGERTEAWRHHVAIQDWPDAGERPTATAEEPWVSAPHAVAEGFRELIASWNVDVAEGAGAQLEVRVQRGDEWSPWLTVAEWGAVTAEPKEAKEASVAWARVDVDYVRATDDLNAWQARVVAHGGDARLRRVAVVATGAGTLPPSAGPDLDAFAAAVPFHSQHTPDPELSGRLCSPTSVTMALGAAGIACSVADVAAAAHDARHDLYGNWVRNVQAAYALGRAGHVTRFSDWQQVEGVLRGGGAIVISFEFSAGELPAAGYDSEGHLIVLRGFDGEGGVLVSDPAFSTAAEGERVYPRRALSKLWLADSAGTAYVFDRPRPRR